MPSSAIFTSAACDVALLVKGAVYVGPIKIQDVDWPATVNNYPLNKNSLNAL